MSDISFPAYVKNSKARAWVEEMVSLCKPERVNWCDGSQAEHDHLCNLLVSNGTFIKLNESKRPNSYLARSDQGDVARVEDRTFICSAKPEDAGPTNNWIDPLEIKGTLQRLDAWTDHVPHPVQYGSAWLRYCPDRHRVERFTLCGCQHENYDAHGNGGLGCFR